MILRIRDDSMLDTIVRKIAYIKVNNYHPPLSDTFENIAETVRTIRILR
jgi:hypothetical protein